MGSLTWRAKDARVATPEPDPLSPPPPRPAYYDPHLNAWVLSRYVDVFAALHEPRLVPVDSRAETLPDHAALDAQHRLRTEAMTILSRPNVESRRNQFVALARNTIEKLPSGTRVDIIKQFAEPFCLTVAVSITTADPADLERLRALAHTVSRAAADPLNQWLRHSAKVANLQVAKILASSPIPMGGPTFVALSQTLPRFLANAWLALLRHPRQLDQLRGEPDLMSYAVEELLRYAGLAHKLFRRCSATINIAGVTIARGSRVILMLSSANRDPEQFLDPDGLDISRRSRSQLALGAGSHSCAGVSLIKMAVGIATAVWVEHVAAADTMTPIEWEGGSGFRFAKSLYVLLHERC
jgi:cytochrome P450